MRMFLILAGSGVAILLAVAGCSAWLVWESQKLHTVGDPATYEETAECLDRYTDALAGRPYKVTLDRGRVEACFSPQTPAKAKALILCFNTYEREHRGHFDWPGGNLRACTWDGMTASQSIATVTFGEAVAVPATPRAGRRVDVAFATREADADTIHEAVASDSLEVLLLIEGDNDLTTPNEIGLGADGRFHVRAFVPETAAGKRLTVSLTTAPDTPAAVTTEATFTISR